MSPSVPASVSGSPSSETAEQAKDAADDEIVGTLVALAARNRAQLADTSVQAPPDPAQRLEAGAKALRDYSDTPFARSLAEAITDVLAALAARDREIAELKEKVKRKNAAIQAEMSARYAQQDAAEGEVERLRSALAACIGPNTSRDGSYIHATFQMQRTTWEAARKALAESSAQAGKGDTNG